MENYTENGTDCSTDNSTERKLTQFNLRPDLTNETISELLQERMGGIDLLVNLLIISNQRKDIKIAELTNWKRTSIAVSSVWKKKN